ncbi:MAG TPA: sulfotransferase [Rhizomicrobium sp.]|nr:sulfotransferase [Rhizomicrobium sp.]
MPSSPAPQDAFALATRRLNAERAQRQADEAGAFALQGETAMQRRQLAEAVRLFARAVALAPDFAVARFNLARLLFQTGRMDEALGEVGTLLAAEPENPLFRQLKANILQNTGAEEQALAIFEALARENPGRAVSWLAYGLALRAVGAQENSVAAYRRAIHCRPSYGQAWWALANLKTLRFSEADIEAMSAQLSRIDIAQDDRIPLQFALGKALEDAGAYEKSFEHYAKANALGRRTDFDMDKVGERVAATKALFTPQFLKSRDGMGCPAQGPIFVVGRPRSGSTLIEQILASHSMIEGTDELPYIQDIARRLEARGDYPAVLMDLTPEELKTLGEEFLSRAQPHRKLGRPFFVDKKPGNFSHLGLILLALPHAKIVDARRHPAASCWSMFRQYHAKGTLRLADLGRFHRDYIAYMAHVDRMAPGRIHRVHYEDLVRDPERETRALLDHLGLPFEAGCLRFYESTRAVRTPSSEQVRRPITAEAVDHWRNFEPWLAPLIRSLGSAFEAYPGVPDDLLTPNSTS